MLKTQFRVIDRRVRGDRILSEVDDAVGSLHRRAARFMAERVVAYSPVDTGTYMDSHHVTQGRAGGAPTETSHRKPRGQPREPHESEALTRMYDEIDALPNARETRVSNNAQHARIVEYGRGNSFGYLVYRRAREDTREFIARMVAETRA